MAPGPGVSPTGVSVNRCRRLDQILAALCAIDQRSDLCGDAAMIHILASSRRKCFPGLLVECKLVPSEMRQGNFDHLEPKRTIVSHRAYSLSSLNSLMA
jgi:hypothetical protein